MKNEHTEYLFVSTEKMKEKEIWIKNVCKINNGQTITVKEDSIENIKKKLDGINLSKYQKILVNITGGTKIMSIAVKEFFYEKPFPAEIYYMPINKNEIVELKSEKPIKIDCIITLSDYLKSYGVEIKKEGKPIRDNDFTINFYKNHYDSLMKSGTIGDLRMFRKEKSKENTWPELKKIGFGERLNKNEIEYLTGGWFEEFVYFKIKKELNLEGDYIKIGVKIARGEKNIDNELDVIFLKDYTLYSIECKTSILDSNNEKRSIMSETIYKAKALQKDFGLTAKPRIYTLSSKQEIKDSGMERARYFDIEIKSGEDLNA
jgi:hypothetical protein